MKESKIREIQNKINANNTHIMNDGSDNSLKTESTENTAKSTTYNAIFRI